MLTHCCFFVLFFFKLHLHSSVTHVFIFVHAQTGSLNHPHARTNARSQTSCSICTEALYGQYISPDTHPLLCSYFYFTSQHSTISVCPFFAFSAAVHPKYQKAKEHSDSHKGDGRRGGEELPVVEAEIPHDSKNHHKDRHHQAAGAYGYTCRPESTGDSGPGSCSCSGLSPLLWTGIMQGLRDVAVDHAVVCDV